jgi:excisionase family DNA binding protein
VGEGRTHDTSNNYPGQSKKPSDGYSVTVEEAARRLNLKEDTIRKRVQRGKMSSRRGNGGRMEVILSAEEYFGASGDESKTVQDRTGQDAGAREELVEELRDRVSYLERVLEEERGARTEERRRHDTLMAQLMQRIPEIEAPSEARGAPETAASEAEPEGAEPRSGAPGRHSEAGPQERSWWRRVFGFGE